MRNRLKPRFEITLPMILDQFVKEGHELIWSILDLDSSWDLGSDTQYDDVLSQIYEKIDLPRFFTWTEINEIAKKMSVIIGLTLVGCKDKETVIETYKSFEEPKDHYPKPEEIKPIFEILIDIDDGNLRAILSKNKIVEERCFKQFGPYPTRVYFTPQINDEI